MSNDKKNIKVFETIYQSNSWGDKDSKSGTGSNLGQTAEVRSQLPNLLKELSIKTVLDIPCGDFFWMKEIKNELSEVINSYIGADIVNELVKSNNINFSSEKFRFEHIDLINSELPRVDLIFSRDCLVHLSYSDISKSLGRMISSGSKYLLTTSFDDSDRVNTNIRTGEWRPLNLRKYPFLFSEPKRIILEKCTENDGAYADKTLMLWELGSINTLILKFELRRISILGMLKKMLRKAF